MTASLVRNSTFFSPVPWDLFYVSDHLSNDGAEFGGSIYQKVSDKLETAVNLAWTAGSNSTRFGIAAKYQLDKDASISVSNVAEPFRVGCLMQKKCDY